MRIYGENCAHSLGHDQCWLRWRFHSSEIIKVVNIERSLLFLFARWHPWALVFATRRFLGICALTTWRKHATMLWAVVTAWACTICSLFRASHWDLKLHNGLIIYFSVSRLGWLHVSRLHLLGGILILIFLYILNLISIIKILESSSHLRFWRLIPLGMRKGLVEFPLMHFLGARKCSRLHRWHIANPFTRRSITHIYGASKISLSSGLRRILVNLSLGHILLLCLSKIDLVNNFHVFANFRPNVSVVYATSSLFLQLFGVCSYF